MFRYPLLGRAAPALLTGQNGRKEKFREYNLEKQLQFYGNMLE